MGNVSSIIARLKKERDRVERQLSGLNAALTAFANVYGGGKPIRKRRKMSAKSGQDSCCRGAKVGQVGRLQNVSLPF
jgi:hypothetical protein